MIRIYVPVGERIRVGGDTTGEAVVCKEVSPYEYHCANCCFHRAFPCDAIACKPLERPDGKRVIFMMKGGLK